MENENKCCESTDENLDLLPVEFGDEPIQSGIGLRFDCDNNMIAVGIITQAGNASLGITLEEAKSFADNLNKVISEAEAFAEGYRADKVK